MWANARGRLEAQLRARDHDPNLVIAGIGTNGNVCIYTSAAADLIADLNGHFLYAKHRPATDRPHPRASSRSASERGSKLRSRDGLSLFGAAHSASTTAASPARWDRKSTCGSSRNALPQEEDGRPATSPLPAWSCADLAGVSRARIVDVIEWPLGQ